MKHRITKILPFLGPAFITCVAYIDPGNFATNIQSGSAFGYRLLWVIVMANLIAFLMQMLSAKLGLATGHSLATLCRKHYSHTTVIFMWILAEIGAMATDLAEFLGASIALNILFGLPLLAAAVLVGIITYVALNLNNFGYRPLEIVIGSLVGLIALSYVAETFLSRPDWAAVAYHSVIPWLDGKESFVLAVGILGATVMPHAIYLHSSLTHNRIIPNNDAEKRSMFRRSLPDVMVAMGLAGLVNIAMLYMAASTFHANGKAVSDIFSAYKTLEPLLGRSASIIFAVSLLLSGISSSIVGTLSGQSIMQDFVGFTIPVWIRRFATMFPATLIIVIGIDPTWALVLSQVVLSFVLPLPIVTLIRFTGRKDIMGVLVNKPLTTWLAVLAAALIILLNILLLMFTFMPSTR